MNDYKIVEDATLEGTRITADGYLTANVRCARTGIQEYAGSDFGLAQPVVKVYRPESEVFSKRSLATFVGKPVTDDHPPEPVNSANWRDYARGDIGEDVLRDGEYIRVPITLMDQGVIDKVQSGKREISMGYSMSLAFDSGTTPEGEQYDAVMSNLRMNHLAIVDRGRAGPEVRVGDNWGPSPTTNDGKSIMTLKTVVVDGLSVETTDAGAQAIEKLQNDNKALKQANDEAQSKRDSEAAAKQAAHDAAIAEKDKELAAKDAKIKEAESKILSDADLDKRVAERAQLVSKASQLAKDADFSGKSDHQIMSMAVDAVNGEGFSKDKSEAYIEAAFDLAKVPTDEFRETLRGQDHQQDSSKDNGQADYLKRISDAWKTTGDAA